VEAGSSTVTITTSAATPEGTHSISVTAIAGILTRTSTFTLTVNVPEQPEQPKRGIPIEFLVVGLVVVVLIYFFVIRKK